MRFFTIFVLLAVFSQQARADTPVPLDKGAKLLPNKVGDFRAYVAAYQPQGVLQDQLSRGANVTSAAGRDYVSHNGEKLKVFLITTSSDSAAYALLTRLTLGEFKTPVLIERGDIGTASVGWGSFCKGSTLVLVSNEGQSAQAETPRALARSLADTLDKGEGDIPVLVKHLPAWERAQRTAFYAVSLEELKQVAGYAPVLDGIDFAGGTEAVTVNYDSSRMVIVEFTTPQLAGDNDRRILAKIQELLKEGKPVPTVYRRVGNYAVFVFNAPNQQTANQLIDQVKYEQVVQWLGDNPNWLLDAQKRYTETMLGTFVSVVKASGLAAVLCFGVGGFFGMLLFTRRRAQQAAQRAYSDAGGMMRLNIDELTAETDSHRLLGSGKP